MNIVRYWSGQLRWIITFVMISACVDRIDFDIPLAQQQIVIEGMITDNPGPYTVRVSKGISLNANSLERLPVGSAKIKLFDDLGNEEDFSEVSSGVYQTMGVLQGVVGRSYHIEIETAEGKVFESEPELLRAVGDINDIRFEFEARTVVETFGEVNADVFNIFVDASSEDALENFVRWRLTGTYKVTTRPELHETNVPPYTPYKNPPPCSGYIVVEGVPGGKLERVGDCTCCTCWVNDFENVPQLSDTHLVRGGEFKNIKVGEVPINNATFHDKYLVEVEQFSLTRTAFEYFKLIREQKESASSLFQPPIGEITGNFKSLSGGESVIGLFWATSVKKKSIFIYREDVPYQITPIDFITEACYEFYNNSSSQIPEGWE